VVNLGATVCILKTMVEKVVIIWGNYRVLPRSESWIRLSLPRPFSVPIQAYL